MDTQEDISGKISFAEFKKSFDNKELSGYIWMVEERMVEDKDTNSFIYNNELINFDTINKTKHSFNNIQEAYITDGTYSIHIKNIDGIEQVFVFSEDDFEDEILFKIDKTKSYPSHIKGITTAHFKQVYKLTASVSDDKDHISCALCNMVVPSPSGPPISISGRCPDASQWCSCSASFSVLICLPVRSRATQ